MGVLRYVRLRARHVIALIVFTLLSAATEMGLPTILATMIDAGVSNGNRNLIIGLAAGMVALVAIGCLAGVMGTALSARISTRLAADLREQLFHRVQTFSAADMDRFGTASLVTRSTSDVTNVQMFITMLLQIGVMAPLMLVAGIVLSMATGGRLAMVLFVSVPILLVLAALILRVVSGLSRRLRAKLDDINRIFLETLEGVRPIRAFNRQEYEIGRFGGVNAEYTEVNVAQGRLMAALFPLVGLIFGLTTTGVMWLGAGYVSDGTLEVGALVANVQYISMILFSIMMVSAVVMSYPNFAACGGRIAEVLDTQPSIADGNRTLDSRTSTGTIEFQHVSFIYPDAEEPVIRDLSFKATRGMTVAIIGPTGCGKSSVLKLIPRLYDATLGNVLVDGVNVKRYPLSDLRDLIGYVPQKNVLFTGDIASNLNWGNEQGDLGDWRRALDISCATEFVEAKDGTVHAEVAQRGSNFSGGQRQRLAIARALMKPAEFYLFDDSFSALDMKTDRTLRENIHRELGDATILIVAQRVGTIIDADLILVMDEGVCVGHGTHRELLRTCELYRELATLQLGEDEVAKALATDDSGEQAEASAKAVRASAQERPEVLVSVPLPAKPRASASPARPQEGGDA